MIGQTSDNSYTYTLKNLRQLVRLEAIENWRRYEGDLPISTATDPQTQSRWQQADLNAKRNVSWSPGRQVLWLGQSFVIPPHIGGYDWSGLTIRIALLWWAESAQVFVNGTLVQEGDLFDCFTRICLSPSVRVGEVFNIALRLVSPGHDDGALVRSTFIAEHPENPHLDPGFVADELEILAMWEGENSAILKQAIDLLQISARPDDRPGFDYSILQVSQLLQDKFPHPPATLYLLGHAHLDLAWLWSVSETWKAAERTFTSALSLQTDFPELIFSHSTPALYAWLETHRPNLFSQIQESVKTGNWEVAAGMWVEPELNIISGESIVRQVLYGQRYTRDKFGSISPVVWVPDSFGFTWQLPQILRQGGIEYFVTQKLRWNDTTEFPYDCFWWQSPDGTRIFSLMSALIGQDIDPIKMAGYAVEFQQKTGSDRSLWLPGVGDHGGGPTRDMLEVARRWQDSPVFPHLEFKAAAAYLAELNQQLERETLPTWNDELYLEFHRGCYTTHADQKQANRHSERWLYQAELFSTLATQLSGAAYPQPEIETAWKQVLFNQFHDILPGSAIPEVYEDANRDWQEVEGVGSQLLESALAAICQQITLPQPPQPDAIPIALFNSLNWGRSELVGLPLPNPAASYCVYDLKGRELPTQLTADGMLLLPATDVPSLGYRVVWLCPQMPETPDFSLNSEEKPEKFKNKPNIHNSIAEKSAFLQNDSLDPKIWVLENEIIRVTVDEKTGNLSSFFDKSNHKEILSSAGGNQLQAFQDSGQYWDAWNIDPHYEQHPLPPPTLKSIAWRERGELRQRLRVIRHLGRSEFCQDYILDTGSPILKIDTIADWQERHVLVKAAFHFNFAADFATYEIPCAAIDRTTKPQTEADRAKWEVPALHWADLTANGYGVSLLNDSKYGYDAKPNCLRLSLLRGSTWPDPSADLGWHHFTYAIYPHAGSWQKAHTVRHGYELNQPLLMRTIDRSASTSQLPPVAEFLNLSAENLVVMALKPAEDDPNFWILRCYECHGEPAELDLGEKWAIVESVNLLEEAIDDSPPQRIAIQPWKIATFKLRKRDSRSKW